MAAFNAIALMATNPMAHFSQAGICGLLNVCFAPDSRRTADIPGGPVSAKSGSRQLHSITSSARVSRVGGT
jgi:hypothetical protein